MQFRPAVLRERTLSVSRCSRKQFPNRNSQRLGNACNVVDGDVAFAALYRADVGAVETAKFRECFLRKPLLQPKTPYLSTKEPSNRTRSNLPHGLRGKAGDMTSLRLQPISSIMYQF
jgi:hypothetical protein